MDYDTFIKSDRWQELRKARLKIANYKCENCHKSKPLQVHHKTYERFGGNERMSDLLALCYKCHKEFDKKRKNQESQEIATRIPTFKRLKIVINVSSTNHWAEYTAEIFETFKTPIVIRKGYTKQSANRLQLLGMIAVLKVLNKNHHITLYSSNKYIYTCLTSKSIKANLDLVKELKQLAKPHTIIYKNRLYNSFLLT